MKMFQILLILVLPLSAFTATYFVDSYALDGGDGTINNPFNSLQHAFACLNPGDTLFIRGANSGEGQVYVGDIELPKAGHNSAPISVLNFEKEKVVISLFNKFEINKDFWSFEGLVFFDRNSILSKTNLAGLNNKFKNCVFTGKNLDQFELVAKNNDQFEYCSINISH